MKIKKSNFKLTKDKNNVLTVSPLPTDKSIFNFYEKKYFQKNYGTYKNQNYSRDEINFNYFEPKIVNYFLSTKKKILDIGCGEGHDLQYFLSQKHKCYGADIAEHGIKKHNKNLLKKMEFYSGDILKNEFFPNEKFDVIYSKNFAEHVSNYYKFLKIVNNRLKKNGFFIIIVPNELNLFQGEYLKKNKIKNFKESKFFIPNEHFRYFQPSSLLKSVNSIFKKNKLISLMTTFPIEKFLLDSDTDYYKNKKFGKIAQRLRIKFTNKISEKIDKKIINYMEATAELGIGRTIFLIIKKIK